MTSRGSETLLQRVQNTREREAKRQAHGTTGFHGKQPAPWADALAEAKPSEQPPPIKHCWYDGPNGTQPALLLGWRQLDGHYDGRIAVAALEPEGWAIVEMWVEQEMLRPT
jgi:hypothetical protein